MLEDFLWELNKLVPLSLPSLRRVAGFKFFIKEVEYVADYFRFYSFYIEELVGTVFP